MLLRGEWLTPPLHSLTIIDKRVAKGSHFVRHIPSSFLFPTLIPPLMFVQVECQLLGEEGKASPPFKILGIFAT